MTEHTQESSHSLIEYAIDVHALSQFRESDIDLSLRVADKFTLCLQEAGISNCELRVSDGYVTEEKAHYMTAARYGEGNTPLVQAGSLSIKYTAVDEGQKIEGSIRVAVKLPASLAKKTHKALEEKALHLYQMLMDEIYIGWETKYDEAGAQFVEELS